MPKSSSAAWRRRRFSTFFAALAMVAVVSACDSSSDSDGSVALLTVNPPAPTLNIGSVQQLVATATTAGGAIVNATPTWTTSAAAVATVDANGLVTAVGGGTATITATAAGESADAVVNVWFPVASVAIAPAVGQPATVPQEGSTQLAATITDTQGAAAPARQLVWTSSNPAVATVSSSGRVSARGIDGTTTITATSLVGAIAGTTVVTVSGPPVVFAVSLTAPLGRYMAPGMTDQLVIVATAASGTVLSLTGRTVVWSNTNPAAATVTAGGLVTGVANGTTAIDVSVDGVSANGTATLPMSVYPALTSGVPTANGNLAPGASVFYVINVPAGATSLVVTTSGEVNAGADLDLIVLRPTGAAGGSAFTGSSNETVTIATPPAGRYRVEVNAWDGAGASTGSMVTATVTP